MLWTAHIQVHCADVIGNHFCALESRYGIGTAYLKDDSLIRNRLEDDTFCVINEIYCPVLIIDDASATHYATVHDLLRIAHRRTIL